LYNIYWSVKYSNTEIDISVPSTLAS